MTYLVAAVVLVGLLCVVDLLLTAAIIRRLREHTRLLAALQSGGDTPPDLLLPVGTPLPAFTAEAVDGTTVDSGTTPPTVVAFLSTTCVACAEQLPRLADHLRAEGAGRDAAVVVVTGDDTAEGKRMVAALGGLATVVREPLHGPVCQAFSAEVFPTFYRVDDGVVAAGAIVVEGLADPVAA